MAPACSTLMMPSSTICCISSGRAPATARSCAGRGRSGAMSSVSSGLMQVRCSSNKDSGRSTSNPPAEATSPASLSSSKQELSREQPIRGTGPASIALGSLFAFDGAAPETINGRMAMVGFVWALAAEKMTGLTVVEQLFNPATSGLLWFAVVVQLFTMASIIPLISKGESTKSPAGWGPFKATAEQWNGRLAMLGFAALLVGELIRQGPLLQA